MNFDAVTATVSRVTYRGWHFHVDEMADGFFVQVCFYDDDDDELATLQHGRKWYVSRHATVSEVVQTCLAAVLAAVEHEAREKFLVDGRPIFHPHHNVEDLLPLSRRTDARIFVPAPCASEARP